MFQGEVLAITTRPGRKEPVVSRESVTAIPGQGLEGDHGSQLERAPHRQVTLIEAEALELAVADYGLELTHAESRRNLLTRGVPLNHLVGRQFRVGDVLLEGAELCEPCTYLEGCLDRDLVDALRHRGGLRARVVEGGEISVGAAIQIHETLETPAT